MTIGPNTTNFRQSLGRMGEQLAEKSLLEQGWQVLERNYRVHRRGELDIIARPPEGDVLAFIEVKTRDIKPWQLDLEHPGQEAVDANKQRRLFRAAMAYLAAHPGGGATLRFDLILVDISLDRQHLLEVIALDDLETLARYARLSHLGGISGMF
ncbi:MAG: YraN family protein [Cyanobacteria bacterium REEB67]|nr:YraN family protein [Cyanobacteria bacterium REEB67]